MPLFGTPNVEKMRAKRDVKGLIKALGYEKASEVRHAAAQALGEIGDTHAVEPLVARLKDNEVDMRKIVAEALGKIGDARAVQPLIAVQKDNDEEFSVKLSVSSALKNISDPRAIELFIAALKDDHAGVRSDAAEALGNIGDPRAVQPIVTLLKDDPGRRYKAAQALRKLGWEPDNGEIGAWYWIAQGCSVTKGDWEKVVALGPVAINPLIATIKELSYTARVRLSAAEALDQLGWKPDEGETGAYYWIAKGDWRKVMALGPAGIEPLIAHVDHSHSPDISSAVEVLGEIGDPRAVECLNHILKAMHWEPKYIEVRQAAAKALGEIGDPRAVEPLTAASKDKWSEVSKAAVAALSKIGTAPKLTVSNDNIVIDKRLGLIWQRAEDGIERTYDDALSYCRSLKLAGHNDWRLPSNEELQELASVPFETLKQIFPDIKAERYWAQATADQLRWAEAPERIAYTVDFDPESGNYRKPITYFKTNSYFVRSVRNAK